MGPDKKTITTKEIASGGLSFSDFKKSLGLASNNYSDEEIEHIRIMFDKLADQVFDSWIKRINSGTIVNNTSPIL